MAVTSLAAGARVPVLLAPGGRSREAIDALACSPQLERVDSPRHATVLLVVGSIPEPLAAPLARVHDQLPGPRGTVWWGGATDASVLPAARRLPATATAEEVADAVVAQHRAVVTRALPSEPDLLPDAPPNPWEGVGPHGQGGEGMMMGTPYGRPMAMTAEDRDGLALDQLWLCLGPFLPGFPPGLVLRVALQGDVLQDVTVTANPFETGVPAHGEGVDAPAHAPDAQLRVAEVERCRAARQLSAVATLLELRGLPAPALRARQATCGLRSGTGSAAGDVTRLARRLRRARLLRGSLHGVGATAATGLRSMLAGPDARAAGDVRDHRADDPAYAGLGFQPIGHHDGDAWSRLCQRLAEVEQSLDLARRAGDRTTTLADRERATDPRVLEPLLTGQEIGDAVTTVASLGIDLEVRTPAIAGDGR